MPDYRLYFLDPAGSIAAVEEFIAPDDDEAIRLTRDGRGAQQRELWCRARMIQAIDPSR